MIKIQKIGTCLAAAILALSVSAANATGTSVGLWDVTITTPAVNGNVQYNGTWEDAGGVYVTFNTTATDPSQYTAGTKLTAYCVDITNPIYVPWGPGNVNVELPTSLTGPTPPPTITDSQWGQVSWIYQKYGAGQIVNTDTASAAQIAIWEVLYPTAVFNNYSSGIGTKLGLITANISGGYYPTNYDSYYIKRMDNSNGQSLITGTKPSSVGTQGGAVTPEASSLAMLLPGLLPLGLVLKRRK